MINHATSHCMHLFSDGRAVLYKALHAVGPLSRRVFIFFLWLRRCASLPVFCLFGFVCFFGEPHHVRLPEFSSGLRPLSERRQPESANRAAHLVPCPADYSKILNFIKSWREACKA